MKCERGGLKRMRAFMASMEKRGIKTIKQQAAEKGTTRQPVYRRVNGITVVELTRCQGATYFASHGYVPCLNAHYMKNEQDGYVHYNHLLRGWVIEN